MLYKLIFPKAEVELMESNEKLNVTRGRFKEIKFHCKLKLTTSDTVQKQTLYKELVTEMFKDQLAWINDKTHLRKIDQNNAVNSLKSAEEAELLAVKLYV